MRHPWKKWLAVVLAVLCLASVCAVVSSAETVEVKTYTKLTGTPAVDDVILLVTQYGGKYYAMNVDGNYLKPKEVTVDAEAGTVTSEVTDSMLFKVGKSSYYYTYESVAKNGYYLNCTGISTTAETFYSGVSNINCTDHDRYITFTGSSYSYNKNEGSTFEAYKQTVTQEEVGGGETGEEEQPSQADPLTLTYQKVDTTSFIDYAGKPVLLVQLYNGKYYWGVKTNGATGIAGVSLAVDESGKITTEITADMLWVIEGTYDTRFAIKSYSNNKYLKAYYSWGNYVGTDTTIRYFSNQNMSLKPEDGTSGYYFYMNGSTPAMTQTQTQWIIFAPQAPVENAATVHFDGGNTAVTGSMNDVQVEKNTTYILPQCQFELAGYAFAGWSVNGQIMAAGETITVSEDTTLTATWEYNKWNITYRMEGKDDVVKTVEKGKTHYVFSFTSVFSSSDVPAGKIFSEWLGSDGKHYSASTNYTFTADMVLTPVFVDAVTITFDLTDEQKPSGYNYFGSKPYAAGSTQKIPGNESWYTDTDYAGYLPTAPSGYVFKGWMCNGTFYKLGESYTVSDSDMVFTPVFGGYTITFQVNGEVYKTVEIPTNLGNYDYVYFYRDYGLTDPTVEGYIFKKWVCTTNSSVNFSSSNGYTMASNLKGGVTFEAELEEVKLGTITLHCGENSVVLENVDLSVYINFNVDLFNPNFTLPEGFRFLGWYTDSECKNSIAGLNLPTDGAHYYALTEETYTVTFDYGIENVAPRNAIGTLTNPVTVPYYYVGSELPEKTGYTLIGWSLTPDGEIAYEAKQNVKVEEACTLYAVWEYNYWKITFVVDGEETVKEVPKTSGSVVIANWMTNPEKEDFHFVGWFDAEVGGEQYRDSFANDGDKTLYAHFTPFTVDDYIKATTANLTLDGVIGLNIHYTLDEKLSSKEGAYIAVVGVDGNERKLYLKDMTVDAGGRYTVTEYVIAAQMTEMISFRVYDGEGGCSEVLTYSVKTYGDEFLKLTPDGKMADLVRSMLNYGAYAQQLFGYKTDDLANAGVFAEESNPVDAVTADTVNSPAVKSGSVAGIARMSASLALESRTSITFFIALNQGENIADYSFMLDGTAVTPVLGQDGRYMVTVENLAAHELTKECTLTVTKGTETVSVTYSAMAYADAAIRAGQNEALVNLAKALYLYSNAAEAYVNP